MKKNLSIKELSSINGGKKNGALCSAAMWGMGAGLGVTGGLMSGGLAGVSGAAIGATIGHNIAC